MARGRRLGTLNLDMLSLSQEYANLYFFDIYTNFSIQFAQMFIQDYWPKRDTP